MKTKIIERNWTKNNPKACEKYLETPDSYTGLLSGNDVQIAISLLLWKLTKNKLV